MYFSALCDKFQLDATGMKYLNQHDLALQAVSLKTGERGTIYSALKGWQPSNDAVR